MATRNEKERITLEKIKTKYEALKEENENQKQIIAELNVRNRWLTNLLSTPVPA